MKLVCNLGIQSNPKVIVHACYLLQLRQITVVKSVHVTNMWCHVIIT